VLEGTADRYEEEGRKNIKMLIAFIRLNLKKGHYGYC
jgi:hypothetical protein